MKWPETRLMGGLVCLLVIGRETQTEVKLRNRREGKGLKTGWPRQQKTKTRDESKTKAKRKYSNQEMLIICGGFHWKLGGAEGGNGINIISENSWGCFPIPSLQFQV